MSFNGINFNVDELMASLDAASDPIESDLASLLNQVESPGGSSGTVSPSNPGSSLAPKKKLER